MPKIINNPIPLILSVAKSILYQKGYDALNMRDIAKKCGIATGTIYNYFPNKDDLLVELMIDFWNEFLNVIDKTNSNYSFYSRIRIIYEHFNSFTTTFHEIFIYNNSKIQYSKDTNRMKTKNDFMERFNNRLVKIFYESDIEIPKQLTPIELSEFITANFIAISFSKNYTYDLFEKALKSLLE